MSKQLFFCAAQTSIVFCEQNIESSRKINVINTIKIIEKFSSKNIPVTFLSSNQVFDGTVPSPDETAPAAPKTEYGYQKAQVEAKIMHLLPGHTIVRATKIIHPAYPLFKDWISSLNQKIPIYPFNDMYFSPVSIEFFTNTLLKVSADEEGGIWHVSGDQDLNYHEAALILADNMGADPDLVRPGRAKNKVKDLFIAKSTVLKCSKIKSRLGIEPPVARETVKNTAAQLTKSGTMEGWPFLEGEKEK